MDCRRSSVQVDEPKEKLSAPAEKSPSLQGTTLVKHDKDAHLLSPRTSSPGRGSDGESGRGKSSRRTSRPARKILPANQIFAEGYESFLSLSPSSGSSPAFQSPNVSTTMTSVALSSLSPLSSMDLTAPVGGVMSPTKAKTSGGALDADVFRATPITRDRSKSLADPSTTLPTIPSEVLEGESGPCTPSRPRRRTIVTRSPVKRESVSPTPTACELMDSPSKRKEKSRSHNDLQGLGNGRLGRAITPVSQLEFALSRRKPFELLLHDRRLTFALHSREPCSDAYTTTVCFSGQGYPTPRGRRSEEQANEPRRKCEAR